MYLDSGNRLPDIVGLGRIVGLCEGVTISSSCRTSKEMGQQVISIEPWNEHRVKLAYGTSLRMNAWQCSMRVQIPVPSIVLQALSAESVLEYVG